MDRSNEIAPATGLPVRKAEQIARDSRRTEMLAASVEDKARRNRGALKHVLEDLLALARMLRNYARGQYTHLPWKTVALVAAALLYFITPLDFVPDFLVGGFVDDIGLLLAVLRRVKSDVDGYKSWEKERAGADRS